MSICGDKFGRTGLHTCSSPISFDNSYEMKVHIIKPKIFFEDALCIYTPKTHQCTVYMSPPLPLCAIDQRILVFLFSVERLVEVWT